MISPPNRSIYDDNYTREERSPPPRPPSKPLAVEPAAATVPAAGGASTHTLTNSDAGKIMFKIKSSNINDYRFKPVFGFIDAGATAQIKITRLAGPPKEDKFVVQFAPAPEGATDAKKAFKGATPAGDVTIRCKAE